LDTKSKSISNAIINRTIVRENCILIIYDLFVRLGNEETNDDQLWPELPLAEWKDTYDTLHLWTQIIGRIRLELSPFVNHWWNTTFYVTARGITTSSIHYNGKHFQIDFDFIAHLLKIETNDGSIKNLSLRPCSVTEFYHEITSAMESLGMPITIWTIPVEVQERTPFEKDHKHA
jgi:hypothetical protein